MLCLGRMVGDKIVVDGPCTITINGIRRNYSVAVGIEAAPSVKIMRSELLSEKPATPLEQSDTHG